MAINIRNEYGTAANPESADYPQGSFKNESAPGAGDGSYADEVYSNDWAGFFQKLIHESGITISGVPDTVLASDYFDAMKWLFAHDDDSWEATTTQRGLVRQATDVEATTWADITVFASPAQVKAMFQFSAPASLTWGPHWFGYTSSRTYPLKYSISGDLVTLTGGAFREASSSAESIAILPAEATPAAYSVIAPIVAELESSAIQACIQISSSGVITLKDYKGDNFPAGTAYVYINVSFPRATA